MLSGHFPAQLAADSHTQITSCLVKRMPLLVIHRANVLLPQTQVETKSMDALLETDGDKSGHADL